MGLFPHGLAQFVEEVNTLARMTEAERVLTLPIGHPLRAAFLLETPKPDSAGDDSGVSV